MVMLAGAGAGAQTLYNAPGESGTPFDFGALFRRDDNRAESPSNQYAAPPASAEPSMESLYQQRRVALDQWRQQRDAQAYTGQQRSLNELAAASEAIAAGYYSPSALPPLPGAQSAPVLSAPPAAPAYVGPMRFDKKDNEGIQTPRRLFNTIE